MKVALVTNVKVRLTVLRRARTQQACYPSSESGVSDADAHKSCRCNRRRSQTPASGLAQVPDGIALSAGCLAASKLRPSNRCHGLSTDVIDDHEIRVDLTFLGLYVKRTRA